MLSACAVVWPILAQDQQAGDADSRLPNPQINPTGQPVGPGGTGEAPVTVWLGHAQSDNVARAAGAGSGRGAYNSFGTSFNLERDHGRFQGSLVGSSEYRAYKDDVAEDERVGNVAATADIAIVPERFSWLIGESYVQGRSDPFGADTVENRENVSVFATGPDVNLRLGDRTLLGFSGTYSERSYEESTYIDGEMLAAEMGLYRQISPTTVVGIVASATEVEYETATTPAYDIDAAYLSYERSLASGNVSVSFGGNELTTAQATVQEPYFELNWARVLAARSTLTLTATSGFTDSGRLLELRPDQVAIDVLLSTDATNRRQVGLEYEWDFTRTTLLVGAAVLTDEFERETALDSDGTEAHIDVTHEVTRLLSLGVSLVNVRRDFTVTGQENEESFARLWLSRRLGEKFLLEAHVQRSEHPGVYTERLYQLTFLYAIGNSGERTQPARGGAGGG